MRQSIRAVVRVCAIATVAGIVFAPRPAAAQQMLNFSFGGFVPNGTQDSAGNVRGRGPGNGGNSADVLTADSSFLDFDFKSFHGPTVGAEYLVGLGDNFDAGVGVSFYQRTVVAADAFSEFKITGDPILADLELRVVPITATFRYLPLGHRGPIVPYIGGGVGVFGWRYTESGDFVASDNVTIISNTFTGSGTTTGPVVLGGARFPIGAWAVGGEVKWQHAYATLPADQSFASRDLDLGGFTYSFTFGVRF